MSYSGSASGYGGGGGGGGSINSVAATSPLTATTISGAVTIAVTTNPSFTGTVTASTGLIATSGGITSSGTTTLSSLTTAGIVTTNSSGVLSSEAVLPIANGGTNASSMTNTDGVVYFDGTKLNTTAVGTATYVLTSNGVGVAPTFQPASGSSGVSSITGTANQITASASTGAVTLSIPSSPILGGLVTSGTGFTATTGNITATTGNVVVTAGSVTITPLSTAGMLINNASGVVASTPTTNHAVQVGNSSGNITSLTVGTNGQVLVGSTGLNPVFATLSSSTLSFTTGAGTLAIDITAPVSVANGGTGATTLTSNGVLLGNTTSAITATTAGTAGQVFLGTAGAPAFTSSPSITGTVTASTGFTATTGNITASTGNLVITAGNVTITPLSTAGIIVNNTSGVLSSITTLPIASGGTNATSMTNTDGVVYYDGTKLNTTTVGTSTYVLTSNGSGVAPSFQAVPVLGVASLTATSPLNASASTGSVTISLSTVPIADGGTGQTSFSAGALSSNGTALTSGTLSVADGGTGATTFSTDGIIYFDGTELASTAVGTATYVLTSNGTGVAPTFQAPSASAGVTSITGTANQITASASTGAVTLSIPSNASLGGTVVVATGLTATTGNITATSGNLVTTNGDLELGGTAASALPAEIDFLKSRSGGVITTGDTLGVITFQGYDGSNYITGSKISSANSGTVATSQIGSNLLFHTHPISTTASTLRMTIDTTGAVTIATPDSGVGLTVSGGGASILGNTAINTSGSGTTTIGGAGAGAIVLDTSNNNIGITASGSGSVNINTTGTGNLVLGNASTTISFPGYAGSGGYLYTLSSGGALDQGATTNHSVQVGNSTGTFTSLTVGTTGQILAGATSANPSFTSSPTIGGTLTLSALSYGVLIASSAGAISAPVGTAGQVLTSGGPGVSPSFATAGVFPINLVTGATVNPMITNNGYITNDGGTLVTLTLPTTSSIGDQLYIIGKDTGGWKIAQASSQLIHFGSMNTTTGTGGYLASTNQFDNVQLVCSLANTAWIVVSSIGNITVN